MAPTLLGTKLGMTRVYTDAGVSMPVTVIQAGPCYVTQIRTPDADGYAGVQVGFGDIKPRNSSIPMIAHDFKAGVEPQRFHREFRVAEGDLGDYEVGKALTVADLEKVAFVDVIGRSKGKGFQGGMKRHGFKGQLASHGVERKHRSPGSIGGHGSEAGASGRPKKGKKMAGHMGDVRVTVRSLEVVKIDAERNLLLVKGPVPGANKGVVVVRPATRLYKSKAAKAAEVAG
ncbi:MAG: 50S ribosomal protein L3 [Phycisphaerae bacterium]|nr:50S ribosomal protein L3 [Phycisphaerae bacterium]